MRAKVAVLIFTKAPELGKVKTRMQPQKSAAFSLALHRQLLAHTIDALRAGSGYELQLLIAGDPQHGFFLQPQFAGIPRTEQQGSGLGERMHGAAVQALRQYRYVILVGSDCPQMNASYISSAIGALEDGNDVVFCPATDGGYVLLGLGRADWQLFEGVDWGSAKVLEQSLQRVRQLSWSYAVLDALEDIDTPEDLPLLSRFGIEIQADT